MEDCNTDRVESTLNNNTPQPPPSSPQGVTNGAQVSGNETQDNTVPEAKRQRIPLSDTYNAQALVRDHGIDLLYCHPWSKWLTWTGTHWQLDTSGVVMRYACNTVMGLTALRKTLPKGMAKVLSAHRMKSLNAPRLKAMVELAQSIPGIPVQPIQLDNDHWLLNCLNGTLDLRTGILRPHERDDLLTIACLI
jgi:putative DNA primase/helicase